jgi:predicted transcriptional regulator
MREIGRRVERDIRRVHGDVHALLDLGLAEKTASGKISCPFEEIRIRADIDLKLAA